jgi:hypothetical protein
MTSKYAAGVFDTRDNQDLGFRNNQDLGFRIQDLGKPGFRIQDLGKPGFRIKDLGSIRHIVPES